MQVNMILQLLLIILSCGGAGIAVTALLLPHWIVYYHHSRFWERTNILSMGIFNSGRFGEAVRPEHGNRPVDWKHISEGRWTTYSMQCVRTASITSVACGSLAAFLGIWHGLRFGSDKSIPCGCLAFRCILLITAATGLSLATGLFIYIVWPLLQHKTRLLNAGLELDEEMELDVCIYLTCGAIAAFFLAFLVDMSILCCRRHRRRYYREERRIHKTHKNTVILENRRRGRYSSEASPSKRRLKKYHRRDSVSTDSIHLSSKSSSSKPSCHSITVRGVKRTPSEEWKTDHFVEQMDTHSHEQSHVRRPQHRINYHPHTDKPRRKAPDVPVVKLSTPQCNRRRQRAQSESARDVRQRTSSPEFHNSDNRTKTVRISRRPPPPIPGETYYNEHVNYSHIHSKDTIVSYSNSSLESSFSSHDTLL